MAKRAARDLSGQEGLRLAPTAVALVLGLTLAACTNGSTSPAETDAATTDPNATAAQSAAALASETEDEIDPTGPTPPILAAAPAIKPAIDHDPKALIGLDRNGLSKLLGEPRLVRRETPAEIWQYVGTECVFDVFLYEEQGAYRVIHAEARDDEVPLKTEPRTFLNQLLRERQDKPVS